MKRSRLTTFTTLVAALGCGLLVASPVAGLASAVPSRAVAKPAAHPAGFFVTGKGRVAATSSSGALVRDSHGGEHVVTTRRALAASGDRGHVIYSTRQPGAKHWTTHELPGLRPMGRINIEAHLTWDSAHVFVVLYQCDGVYETEVSLAGTRLPTPSLVQTANTCPNPGSLPAASAPPIAEAFPKPGFSDPKQISVLLDDPAQGNKPALFSGPPAGPFKASDALPTADGFVPQQMTIDRDTGRIVAIGSGISDGNRAIYETTCTSEFCAERLPADYGSSWSALTKIASLGSPTNDYRVESVAAFDAAIWVGLLKPRDPASPTRPTLYLVHHAKYGGWIGAVRLPHTTGQDTALQLAINPRTGSPLAAFTRRNPAATVAKSGIMVDTRLAGRWQLKFLTHWAHDYTQSLTSTGKRRAVIGYIQR
jgi:hypothetical protein